MGRLLALTCERMMASDNSSPIVDSPWALSWARWALDVKGCWSRGFRTYGREREREREEEEEDGGGEGEG